ncbi:MAG: DUF1508 domain-containing protein [Clostridiaceae bacterium]|jgi:uncharacterized protein YegP (UPF0339 family)|nr:DUF1508 domain-containing protein [Clostridiaceae bacterium]
MSEKGAGGKYIVFASVTRPGQFRFTLKAVNGVVLYESKDFASIKSCKGGIDTFKKAIKEGDFVVEADRNDELFMFNLQNGGVTYIGELLRDRNSALNNVENVKKYAFTETIVDEIEQAKEAATKQADAAKAKAAKIKAAEDEKAAKKAAKKAKK